MTSSPHQNGVNGIDSDAAESQPLLGTVFRRATIEVHPDGESGRSGFHPTHFIGILWRSSNKVSSAVNYLWPFVPLALIFRYAITVSPLTLFGMTYVGMVPVANLLGFAGQEFARKMPKVSGILIETTFGSIVEIILFLTLLAQHDTEKGHAGQGNMIPVIQAAILGSILTNLLLCLGLCFFVGGIRMQVQSFHSAVSEVGNGLLLVAGFGLLIPSAFYSALKGSAVPNLDLPIFKEPKYTEDRLQHDVLKISQTTSILLIVAFVVYIWFNARSNHSIFDEVLEADEHRDLDRHNDLDKPKFTFTECILALAVSIALVTLFAIILVEQIEDIVEAGIPDQFLGLILLPLAEKAAEHLTAVDEAWDGQMNLALFHCLGPSIQTALFNAPLVVIIGWITGKDIDLNFEIFMIALLVLSILVTGNFLRDNECNYLEGALLVIIYLIMAVAAWYYPNPDVASSNGSTYLNMDGIDDDQTPRPLRRTGILATEQPPPTGPIFGTSIPYTPRPLRTIQEASTAGIPLEASRRLQSEERASDTSSQKKRRRNESSDTKTPEKRRKGRRISNAESAVTPDDTSSQTSSYSGRSTSSKASVSSDKSKFSERTKWEVEQLSDDSCWVCGNERTSLDVCHVIARKDPGFSDISSRGIVPFEHRGDKSNAIPLCKRCHDGFDSVRPQVIILPVDLDYFLDFELRDYKERSETMHTQPRRRITPSGDHYRAHLLNSRPKSIEPKYLNELEDSELAGGLYQIYLREDILGTRRNPIPLGRYDEPRIWHGSPTALIIHASRALACVDCTNWLSEDVLDTLNAIIKAWRKEPVLNELDQKVLPQEIFTSVANESSAASSRDDDQRTHEESENASGTRSRGGDTEAVDDESSVTDYSGDILPTKDWKWGPSFTANQILRIYCAD
ncbi:hypothetical protein H072_11055 [Dactylellina haptotyla CBS 200.50]|uniref:Sodium/calcium exchanger membrane region domain-containing protein n=1 Tax=Dactylellina haptotyla (strain CBS 200.50) TaxID=1284197 RepID=S8BJX3_DACHA|nr:hypothetical protein H072_11055 [Dactylellina haptotyla CBS 200.50]